MTAAHVVIYLNKEDYAFYRDNMRSLNESARQHFRNHITHLRTCSVNPPSSDSVNVSVPGTGTVSVSGNVCSIPAIDGDDYDPFDPSFPCADYDADHEEEEEEICFDTG